MLNRPQGGPFFPSCELGQAIAQLRDEREMIERFLIIERDPVIKDLCAELYFRLEEREKDLYETRR
jgi:hypothetical protein